uniref:DUF4832 domain-containing protein n=1 Tax=Acrobeloides nanus TaxID=290746 RepID=A0A914CW92_9BILA
MSLKSSITQVNPGIGLVFWPYTDWTNALNGTNDDPYTAYSLEFFYVPIDQIVVGRVNGTLQYDWSYIEDNVNWIASHGHQAIFRPRYDALGFVDCFGPKIAFDDAAFAKAYENGTYDATAMANMNWFTRYRNHPLGGEIAYYVNSNGVSIQEHALDINGPEGQSLPDNVAEYKYTYLIAGNQPDYHYDGPLTQFQRIRQVGQTFGYKLTVTGFQTNGTNTKVTIKNTGVAPPYYDMHIQINRVTGASTTLKGLQPGNSWTYTVTHPKTTKPTLKIVSPHILSNQTIQYEADL